MGFWSDFFNSCCDEKPKEKQNEEDKTEDSNKKVSDEEKIKIIINEINELISLDNFLKDPILNSITDSDKELIKNYLPRVNFQICEFNPVEKIYPENGVIKAFNIESSHFLDYNNFSYYFVWIENTLINFSKNKSEELIIYLTYSLRHALDLKVCFDLKILDFPDLRYVQLNDLTYQNINISELKIDIIKYRKEKNVTENTDSNIEKIKIEIDKWIIDLLNNTENTESVLMLRYSLNNLKIDYLMNAIKSFFNQKLYIHFIIEEQEIVLFISLYEIAAISKGKNESPIDYKSIKYLDSYRL